MMRGVQPEPYEAGPFGNDEPVSVPGEGLLDSCLGRGGAAVVLFVALAGLLVKVATWVI